MSYLQNVIDAYCQSLWYYDFIRYIDSIIFTHYEMTKCQKIITISGWGISLKKTGTKIGLKKTAYFLWSDEMTHKLANKT